MTGSETISAAWQALSTYLQNQRPAGLAINLGLSLLVLLAAVVLAYLGRRLIRLSARRLPGAATAQKVVSTSRVSGIFIGVIRVVILVVTAAAIAQIWGIDALPWVAAVAAGHLGRLLILILGAAVALEVARFVTGHATSAIAARASNRRRRSQLETLGPLVQGAAQLTIFVIAAMMILSELGVEIGPLLAGAGVVGIAVGFGAQTIVKDVLTGAFLLVEDIVSVGDVVRIGEFGGLVEQMTLRTIRLRDFDGTVHTFPYGEAQVVHNMTKDFSYAVFAIQISYASSIDKALGLMRDVGETLRQESGFRERILDAIEVVGVDGLADNGVVLKARIKTKPLEQWNVAREYNRRIKLAFDAARIEIPFPHMKVVLPESQLAELVRH